MGEFWTEALSLLKNPKAVAHFAVAAIVAAGIWLYVAGDSVLYQRAIQFPGQPWSALFLLAIVGLAASFFIVTPAIWVFDLVSRPLRSGLERWSIKRADLAAKTKVRDAVALLTMPQVFCVRSFVEAHNRVLIRRAIQGAYQDYITLHAQAGGTIDELTALHTGFPAALDSLIDQNFVAGVITRNANDHSAYTLATEVFDLLAAEPERVKARTTPRTVPRLL